MKSSDIRKELHKYLDNADEETLHFLKEQLQSYTSQKLLDKSVFNADVSKPMSMDEYYNMIEQAEEDIQKGNLINEKEVDKILKRWDEEV
jgi:hypothetical protein